MRSMEFGREFELAFEQQAIGRGYFVVKHCDQSGVNGPKAPMLTGRWKGFRLPDFTLIRDGRSFWAEAKAKSYSPYFGQTGNQRQGIDLPNWRDYLQVSRLSGQPGALFFGVMTTGDILAGNFAKLERHQQIHREPTKDFPGGAVFWPVSILVQWGSFNLKTGQIRFEFK